MARRTPSKSTLAIRLFGKVRRLRDARAARIARWQSQTQKHNEWLVENSNATSAAEAEYKELTGETIPGPPPPRTATG